MEQFVFWYSKWISEICFKLSICYKRNDQKAFILKHLIYGIKLYDTQVILLSNSMAT